MNANELDEWQGWVCKSRNRGCGFCIFTLQELISYGQSLSL